MTTTPTERPLSRWFVLLLAMATGVAVASNYYAQPLLHTISHELNVPISATGIIITAAQLGFAAGLLLLVPLGDLFERRRLILVMCLASILGLIICATAQNITWLLIGTAITGFFVVVAQVIVPFAATLASASERGKVIGTLMSGLFLGILLARTAAGLCSSLGSWRTIYIVAAIVLSIITVLLAKTLPTYPSQTKMSYYRLLNSTAYQFILYPKLIVYSLLGALNFMVFSLLWTPIALLLAGDHFQYNDAIIGLFGLVGAAGALAAPIVGKLADKGKSHLTITLGFSLLASSWIAVHFGEHSVAWLTLGILVLDLAVQTSHVTMMSLVYQLNQESRSRLNACYMLSYFVGGASGSMISTPLFASYGWTGVVIAGAITATTALLIWLIFYYITAHKSESRSA